MYVDFHILNELGTPAILSNTLANRPAASQPGRLFISTDTFEIYRDNGTGWDLIGGPGTSTVTGSGTATQVAFWSGTNSISSSSNLYWDNVNSRLGIGTTTPGAKIDAHGAGTIAQLNGTGTNNSYLSFQQAGTSQYLTGYNYNAGTYQHFQIFDNVGAKNVIGILQSSRFVGIGYQFTGPTDIPQYTFDVYGTTKSNEFISSNITGAISTAKKWKFGDVIGQAVSIDTTQYVEIEIDGILRKLALIIEDSEIITESNEGLLQEDNYFILV